MQFSEVIGHGELKKQLVDEIKYQKVAHAQLFIGKPGYGVLPLALAFVQYLFCDNRSENDSCGSCSACVKTTRLQHPDLHFSFPTVGAVSKTSNGFLDKWREQINEQPYFSLNDWMRKMDPVSQRKPIIATEEGDEIIRKLSLRSFEGGSKVMIIWMAEEMNHYCSNKLLKIIEEPPGDTVFILISEAQEKLLPTIVSRTQIVNVPRINIDDLSHELMTVKTISSSDADSIAARVDGDLIQALEILGSHEESDENRDLFMQLMRVCYKKNVVDMLDWSDAIAGKNRARQKIFLEYALHMFRQSMLRNYTEDRLTRVSEEEEAFLNNFSRFITGNNVFDFMETFNNAHYHIDRNANGRILFTNLCFQVMRYIHAA